MPIKSYGRKTFGGGGSARPPLVTEGLKQELVYRETKARTWSQEYQCKTGIIFNKTNSKNKGQLLTDTQN